MAPASEFVSRTSRPAAATGSKSESSPVPRSGLWVACILLAACQTPAARSQGLERFEFERAQMGTLFRIVLHARERSLAEQAASAAFARLDELDGMLSDYDPHSELSRLSRASQGQVPTAWIAVSPDLFLVLARARTISEASGGAFDATCGVATRLWRRAIRELELPDPQAIAQARASIDWRALELSAERGSVRWIRAGMRLDLGGIAKGYALDRMLAVLVEHGIDSALLIGGGDIVAAAPPPQSKAWRIELASPTPAIENSGMVIELSRGAVATSGDLYQAATIEGTRYSHIVDPRTAMGLSRACGASVIAGDGMTADALATAATVLGPADSARLWEGFEGCEFFVVAASDSGMECAQSPGFARFLAR